MLDLFNTDQFVIFTTRDYANRAQLSMPSASRKLSRLTEKKLLTRITKGLWANINHPYFHPLSCVPFLLLKEQGDVSFLTALHLHGILSQIPGTIQTASTGHGRKLQSSIATFEFIQIKPELMQQGVQWSDTSLPYLIASAEKAMFDVLYIATRKNRRFARLPELLFDDRVFSNRRFKQLFRQAQLSSRILNSMSLRAGALGLL